MKKSVICNTRILQAILAIVFSIFFIFIALNPSVAYAADDDSTHIGQVMNLMSYGSNEVDESSNETAGYLDWAASGDRSGVYFYVVTDKGTVAAHGILLDKAGEVQWGNYVLRATSDKNYGHNVQITSRTGYADVAGSTNGSVIDSIKYVDGISPVYYSGGWQAKGSSAMSYLTQDSGKDIEIKGVRIPLPNWAWYVYKTEGGAEALKDLAKPDTKWRVILEPVSVNFLYSDSTFDKETTAADGTVFAKGSPMPSFIREGAGKTAKFKPIAYFATAWRYIDLSNNVTHTEGGGKYTKKFYNTQLPFSLCLDHDIEVGSYSGGKSSYTAVKSSVHPISRAASLGREGIAIAAIDITGFTLPPIHTFDGTNTPGNTETPDPDKGTNGDCVIKKYYYTELLNSDGTIKEAETDPHHYTQLQTTNYISIDGEDGYELVGL